MARDWLRLLWVFVISFLAAPAAMAQGGGSSYDPDLFTNPNNNVYQYSSQPPRWSRQGTATYQKQDGTWQRVASDGTPVQDQNLWESTQKKIKLAGDEAKGNVAVWALGDPNDPNHLSLLGASGAAKWEGGITPDGVQFAVDAKGRVYLVEIQLEGKLVDLGDKDLGLELGGKGDAYAGADAGVNADANISTSGVKVNAGAQAFAGAKAAGDINLTGQLCKLAASGKVKGEVSAGAGAKALGTVEVDWSSLKVKLSGELAATLGLGAGVGTEVEVDLGELVSDPGAVLKCLGDKVIAVGEAAIETGVEMVEVAADTAVAAGEVVYDGAVAAGEVAYDGAVALANGVDRAKRAVTSRAASAAVSAWNFVSYPFTGTCR